MKIEEYVHLYIILGICIDDYYYTHIVVNISKMIDILIKSQNTSYVDNKSRYEIVYGLMNKSVNF